MLPCLKLQAARLKRFYCFVLTLALQVEGGRWGFEGCSWGFGAPQRLLSLRYTILGMCLSVVDLESGLKSLRLVNLTKVWILQVIYPLKDEWVFGCSLKTRLADQTKTQQLKWLWSKDSMNSTINQRLGGQTQEKNFKLEGSGGSTLDDTLRKQYLSSSD